MGHAQQALDLYRAAGNKPGQARAVNAIGWFQAMLGDYEQAVAFCEQTLDLQHELSDGFGRAETWDSLGYASQRLGRTAAAIAAYRTAVETPWPQVTRNSSRHRESRSSGPASGWWRWRMLFTRGVSGWTCS